MSTGKWKQDGRRIHPPLWDTDSEIVFIDGLGTHSLSRASRLEMLKGYLKALLLPGPMKGMDKQHIKTYVKNSIAMEEAYPSDKRLPRDRLESVLNQSEPNDMGTEEKCTGGTVELITIEMVLF